MMVLDIRCSIIRYAVKLYLQTISIDELHAVLTLHSHHIRWRLGSSRSSRPPPRKHTFFIKPLLTVRLSRPRSQRKRHPLTNSRRSRSSSRMASLWLHRPHRRHRRNRSPVWLRRQSSITISLRRLWSCCRSRHTYTYSNFFVAAFNAAKVRSGFVYSSAVEHDCCYDYCNADEAEEYADADLGARRETIIFVIVIVIVVSVVVFVVIILFAVVAVVLWWRAVCILRATIKWFPIFRRHSFESLVRWIALVTSIVAATLP